MTTTKHAEARLRERAPGLDFMALWQVGRDATDNDFAQFCWTVPRPGALYRVAVKGGAVFLLARSASTGVFITIIRRKPVP